MKRRLFKTLVVSLAAVTVLGSIPASAGTGGQLVSYTLPENAMYNGIVVPDGYEFGRDFNDSSVQTAPYLLDPEEGGYAPDVINIDVGRQLFVDDFLIESTDLSRSYYSAVKYENNPVLYPEEEWELTGGDRGAPSVGATSGGLWYDMEDKLYKMWYEASWNGNLAYATSTDGINWERPVLNPDGSNTMIRQANTDSFVVWIDYDADPSEKYKLMNRQPGTEFPAQLYVSANGTNWRKIGETGDMHDRSTFFYNPFTKQWVFSIRYNIEDYNGGSMWNGIKRGFNRARSYHAGDTFLEAADWNELSDTTKWLFADDADLIDHTASGSMPQLYNFDSIAYESLMIGMFEMWYGPSNDVINKTGWPKICDIQAGFSRDGFHYDRPYREALIPATRTKDTWDYGYLSPMGGGLIVYDNEIRIYYSGYSGYWYVDSERMQCAYAGGCIGYAVLRRDGFASMNGTGTLTTNPLTVTKDVKHLFVNTNSTGGSIKAEILDVAGNVISGYSKDDCVAIVDNTAKARFEWSGGKDLAMLQGKQFKIKFYFDNAQLYSFWLAPDELGVSGGELGAGYIGEETPLPEQTVAYTTDATTEATTAEPAKKGCKSSVGASMIAMAVTTVGVGVTFAKKKTKRSRNGR